MDFGTVCISSSSSSSLGRRGGHFTRDRENLLDATFPFLLQTSVKLYGIRGHVVGIDGQSLGNGTAFSAVAPSQRPVCDAHQSKIFGSGIPIMSPRARIPERLTSSRLISSARTAADPTLSNTVARLLHTAR
jgi:hypothetical protein